MIDNKQEDHPENHVITTMNESSQRPIEIELLPNASTLAKVGTRTREPHFLDPDMNPTMERNLNMSNSRPFLISKSASSVEKTKPTPRSFSNRRSRDPQNQASRESIVAAVATMQDSESTIKPTVPPVNNINPRTVSARLEVAHNEPDITRVENAPGQSRMHNNHQHSRRPLFTPVEANSFVMVDKTAINSLNKKRIPVKKLVPNPWAKEGHPDSSLLIKEVTPDLFYVSGSPAVGSHLPTEGAHTAAPLASPTAGNILDEAYNRGLNGVDDEPPMWWLELYGYTKEDHDLMKKAKTEKSLPAATTRKPTFSLARTMRRGTSRSKSMKFEESEVEDDVESCDSQN
eukprot:GHVH01016554.1.p1 GENE.GHVH01016554.1~~GHVH01016554.1.p1  ORF type:complete len:345 (+),score=46.13 GHVH01016554.1:611-1645(+)